MYINGIETNYASIQWFLTGQHMKMQWMHPILTAEVVSKNWFTKCFFTCFQYKRNCPAAPWSTRICKHWLFSLKVSSSRSHFLLSEVFAISVNMERPCLHSSALRLTSKHLVQTFASISSAMFASNFFKVRNPSSEIVVRKGEIRLTLSTCVVASNMIDSRILIQKSWFWVVNPHLDELFLALGDHMSFFLNCHLRHFKYQLWKLAFHSARSPELNQAETSLCWKLNLWWNS